MLYLLIQISWMHKDAKITLTQEVNFILNYPLSNQIRLLGLSYDHFIVSTPVLRIWIQGVKYKLKTAKKKTFLLLNPKCKRLKKERL